MTLEEQLDHFDRRARWVYALSLTRLNDLDYEDAVIAKARERLIAGYTVYGDLMYTRDRERLLEEALEEHADGLVNYPLAMDWKDDDSNKRWVANEFPRDVVVFVDLPDRMTP